MNDLSSTSPGSPDTTHPDQWTSQQVTRWMSTLTPATLSKSYASKFKENDIVGEALIQLDPESLKDIGVNSVGHRLLILKAIYELKIKWGIEVGADDWKPTQDGIGSSPSSSASIKTLAGISAIAMLRALQERDERVRALELELARLEDWLIRWTGEMGHPFKVDPLQPYFPPSKAYSSLPEGMHPLDDYNASTQMLGMSSERMVSSAFSGPVTAINSAEADTSNIGDESIPFGGPRKASLATPSSATFSSHDHPSNYAPGNVSQMEMSPTSSTATLSATPTSAHPPLANVSGDAIALSRLASPTSAAAANNVSIATSQGNAAVAAAAAAAAAVASSSNSASHRGVSSGGPSSPLLSATSLTTNDGKREDKSVGAADTPYKSFRVTLDDPCHKVLPAALKKYKINDDWRQYALFICYGTTERCLSYDEKPLLLFQKLKEAKQSPVFMLRHIRDVKSPIAIASAKAAARKSASGSSTSQSGGKLSTSTSASSLSGARGAKAADVSGRFGGSKDRSENSSEKKSEEKYIDSLPGKPALSGPAAQLDNSKTTTTGIDSFAIAIYPYVSEREDELDVSVGDTFIVKSKAKGWWIVQRDSKASGQADVVGIVKNIEGSSKNGGEIRSGWVPAGCLLETKQPLSLILSPDGHRAHSPTTPNEGTFSYQQQRAPASPGTLEDDINTPKPSSLSNYMANAPIPPSLITSTSTPGILLMDFHSPEENIHLQKDARLRVFKRYNHWSYCVEEGSRHARAWLPSWYIGKVGSSSRMGGSASNGGNTISASSANGNSLQRGASGRSEALPLM